jgi:hypothetical protein
MLPGSLSGGKRRREGSIDLETGLDAKKTRTGVELPVSNLTKSKSKSMMNIAGGKAAPSGPRAAAKPALGAAPRPRVAAAVRPVATARPTAGSALNDRTNRSAASTRGGGPAAPKPAAGGSKRPAWDVKGRMEDMERKFEAMQRKAESLEVSKQELQTDVEVKHEVVVKSSEEIR